MRVDSLIFFKIEKNIKNLLKSHIFKFYSPIVYIMLQNKSKNYPLKSLFFIKRCFKLFQRSSGSKLNNTST